MTDTTKPDKLTVREYMERRTHEPLEPPPSPEDIRRELGWYMLPSTHRPDRIDRD